MLELLKHVPPLVLEHRLTELTYFTTDICNMKCRHCFVNDALNRKQPHLSVEEISRMSAHIPAMQRVHLGGGEPFTRADLGELAVRVSNEWRAGVVCVPTNGWFTDRILAGMTHFGEHGRGNLRLHFSINSADPVEMDRFTQLEGSFARWRRSIDAALNLSVRFPQITVVALATFNEHNQHNFETLIDFLHDDVGVEDFSFQLVRTHGDYAPALDIARFREMNAYYFRRWNRQNPVLASFREATRERSADYFQAPRYVKRCTSGKIRVVMSPAGDVYPCEKLGYPNLGKMGAWRMGNVRDFDYDVNALVRSPKARALYRRIVDGHCHCDHNIDQSLSLLSTGAFRGRVLKRAAQRLAAGEPAA
ncbi:MAG: radical SAM protein [Alphaproteobacteria bacterium]|nr:MAG: radical SAM protein [Alphaproteobacteria bacterium]